MSRLSELVRTRLSRRVSEHPVGSSLTGLAVVVLAGTALLLLQAARAGTGGASVMAALFTATSAVCDSGLTVVDTGRYWSGFGQVVLLVLMEVGGLGMMMAASLLALTVASRLGLSTRLLADSPTGRVDPPTVRRLVRGTLAVALVLQVLVLAVLTARLHFAHGYAWGKATWYGTFHAVSAFTNAGLTLWPDSLIGLGPDLLLLLTLAVAFVLGGLGYLVLLEVATVRPRRRWSLHTRVTLIGTGILAVLGPLAVIASEWGNPATMPGVSGTARVLESGFAGLSPRTAGFATFDYAHARPATRLVTDALMVIGGGSGGTAGGIKVTTVAVLLLAVLAEVRGLREVEVLGRRIGPSTVRQAIAVLGLSWAVIAVGALLLLPMTSADLDPVLFEVSSAFGTAGLTAGVTAGMPVTGQLVIIALTMLGRVGPITVATALALRRIRRSFRYPEARPVIG